ncbi:MAG: helix-turn-helix domain-containing protein [Bulleidia sp.]
MGKKSIKEDKNIFQLAREEVGLTRAQASEKLVFISESRIEKYESGKSEVHPEEVLAMSKAYKKPLLCNYYCSRMCPIGMENVPEIEMKDLAQIVLKTLATLNTLEEEKDRFIEITADAKVSDDELMDFVRIQKGIEQIGMASDSLAMWMNQMVANGNIDAKRLSEVRAVLEKK